MSVRGAKNILSDEKWGGEEADGREVKSKDASAVQGVRERIDGEEERDNGGRVKVRLRNKLETTHLVIALRDGGVSLIELCTILSMR